MKLATNKSICLTSMMLILAIVLTSCGRKDSAKGVDVIAYVNKEPVFASELDRALSFELSKYSNQKIPSSDIKKKQLELLINRKLIVQEAIDAGLTRNESFVAMIKTYWEQALVRNFIDHKRKEFANEIIVTEKDFREYYKQISKRVIFKVLADTNKERIQNVREQVLAGNVTFDGNWKTIGPIGYQDITSDILRKAFEASQGEALLIEDLPKYYLVYIYRAEDIPQGAFADLEPELKKRVIAIKENQMFDEWLEDKRKKSKIKMVQ